MKLIKKCIIIKKKKMKNKIIFFLELKKRAKRAKNFFTKQPRNIYKNDELVSSLKSKLLLLREVS